MLEQLESQFIKGKLPYSVRNWHLHNRGHHTFVQFMEDHFIKGLENTLYRFGNDEVKYCDKKNTHICVPDFFIEYFNPQDMEYCSLVIDNSSNTWFDINSKSNINSHTKGYQEFLRVDYEDFSNWLWFDIKSYIEHKYSNEATIYLNDYFDVLIKGEGVNKRLKCTYKDIRVEASDKNNTVSLGFDDPQSFYSFTREMKKELESIKFNNSYSLLYDGVVSGKISKEDFMIWIRG